MIACDVGQTRRQKNSEKPGRMTSDEIRGLRGMKKARCAWLVTSWPVRLGLPARFGRRKDFLLCGLQKQGASRGEGAVR